MKNFYILFFSFLFFNINAQVTTTTDNLHRLNNVTQGAATISHTYDPVGNRLHYTVTLNGIAIAPKVYLQGAYETANNTMRDDLRVAKHLPTTEPYTDLAGFSPLNSGGEQTSPVVLQQIGDNAIVDWVFLELRAEQDVQTLVATTAALLQRDGDIVSPNDGRSAVRWPNVGAGNYYVVIRHRNHLAIRSAVPYALSSTATVIDFTSASTAVADPADRVDLGAGVMGMWGGNAQSADGYVRNTPRLFPPPALESDFTYLLDVDLGSNPNTTATGYYTSDVNMDGYVRAKPLLFPPPGIPSDATFILDRVLDSDANKTRTTTN